MIISERLFEIMDKKEITQIEFSRATGIAQSTIADWKRKKTNPAADKIMLICDVLNISPYELLQDSKRLNGGYGWLLTTVPTGEAHGLEQRREKFLAE
ncbi:MAG: helix-turn-helix domain-containing protein [Butyrivibrio sp.]|nr:helix-turn-helix domain-containing protein [Butyrivibrio sp.]